MRLISFLLLISLPFASQAQIAGIANMQSDSTKGQAKLSFNFYLQSQSTFLYNSFLYSVLSGNQVNQDAINRMNDQAPNPGRFGYMAHNDLSFEIKNLIPNIDVVEIESGYSRFTNARLNRGLSKTLLGGNKQFAGETALFNNSNLQYLNYQYLKIAGIKSINKKLKIKAGIAILNAQRAASFQLDKGNIYTDIDGNHVDIALQGSAMLSDTSKNGFFSSAGMGATFHAGVVYKIDKNKSFAFEANHFGAVFLNPNSSHYSLNNSYSWGGFRVSDIFNIRQSELNNFGPDTIVDQIINSEKKSSFSQFVPGRLIAAYEVKSGTTTSQFFAGHYFFSNSLPFIGVERRYFTNRNFQIESNLILGGYGYFSLGAGASYQWNKLRLQFGTFDLQGILLPERLAGLSAYFQMQYTFN